MSLPACAQSPDSPATLGPILVDPASGDQSQLDVEGPFIADPTVGPVLPEPLEYQPGEYPPGLIDRALDAPPVLNGSPRNQAQLPPDYWVLSFRKCQQAGSPCTADQCTQCFYFGPHGPGNRRNPADFYASLRPDVPVVMMVHGSLIDWQQMLNEGHATYEWLRRASPDTPFQMVFVTWPSDRPLALLAPVDFSILGRRSGYNGLYLARVLSRIPSNVSVSLIGHSHGARLVVSALNLVGGGDAYGYRLEPRSTPWPRLRLVMAAAAVDHHWLVPNERYGQALDNTESLLNLRNQNDFALRLYVLRLPLGSESIGRVGFTARDQRLLGSRFDKVRDVEVSSVLGTKHVWPWFYNQPELGRTLAPYLFYKDDLPRTLTLKPERRWSFGASSRLIVQEPASQLPNPANPAGSTVVRGAWPNSALHPTPTNAAPRYPPAQAPVTPSALRAYGRPQVRVP